MSDIEKTFRLLRGSVVLLKRKCGNPSCRCAQGHLHENWALSYSFKGRTKIISLAVEDLPRVRRALARYEKASAALESEALAGIEILRQQRKHQKAEPR